MLIIMQSKLKILLKIIHILRWVRAWGMWGKVGRKGGHYRTYCDLLLICRGPHKISVLCNTEHNSFLNSLLQDKLCFDLYCVDIKRHNMSCISHLSHIVLCTTGHKSFICFVFQGILGPILCIKRHNMYCILYCSTYHDLLIICSGESSCVHIERHSTIMWLIQDMWRNLQQMSCAAPNVRIAAGVCCGWGAEATDPAWGATKILRDPTSQKNFETTLISQTLPRMRLKSCWLKPPIDTGTPPQRGCNGVVHPQSQLGWEQSSYLQR